MDVELPDGTLIQGVPDGITQNQLLQKLYEAKHPAYKALAWQMSKEKPWGSGIPKAAYDIGGKVTDFVAGLGASPNVAGGAGYAANIATQAAPALLSSFRFAGDAPASLAERPAKALMRSAVKPTQADRASGAADEAMTTMLQQDIPPTMSGMDKAAQRARELDDVAEQAIAASPESVSLSSVGQRLRGPAEKALNQVNPQADIDAVKSAWQNFRESPLIQEQANLQSAGSQATQAAGFGDVSLPVRLAHQIKKGTYQSLGGKSYGEVGSVATESQKALARGLREDVAAAVPEAADALKKESELRNVLDVARNRVMLDANKNPMGLAALRIGDNPLSAVGFLADRSAALKGLMARLLYRGAQPQMAVPYATAGEALAERLKK